MKFPEGGIWKKPEYISNPDERNVLPKTKLKRLVVFLLDSMQVLSYGREIALDIVQVTSQDDFILGVYDRSKEDCFFSDGKEIKNHLQSSIQDFYDREEERNIEETNKKKVANTSFAVSILSTKTTRKEIHQVSGEETLSTPSPPDPESSTEIRRNDIQRVCLNEILNENQILKFEISNLVPQLQAGIKNRDQYDEIAFVFYVADAGLLEKTHELAALKAALKPEKESIYLLSDDEKIASRITENSRDPGVSFHIADHFKKAGLGQFSGELHDQANNEFVLQVNLRIT